MGKETDSAWKARVEEKLGHMHRDVKEMRDTIVPMVQGHHTEIALLKRDRKWFRMIFAAIAGFFGAAGHKIFGGHG